MTRSTPFYGWYVVAATFFILLGGFGAAYSFGAFFLPLSRAFDASRAEVSAVFAYATSLIFVTGAVSGHLADRFGARRVVVLGTALIVLGLAGSAAAQSLDAVTLRFALGVGIGVGCVYVPSIGAVQRWFLRRRAFASGLAVTGIGIGTVLMPALIALLLTLTDWRGALYCMAAVIGALCLVAVIFLESDPAARGLGPDGGPPLPPPRRPGGSQDLRGAVRSRPFVQLYAAQILLSFVVLVPFVHVVPYAVDRGVSATAAALLVGLIGVGSTLGRVVIGAAADRFGRRGTLVALLLGLGLAYLWWIAAESQLWLGGFTLAYGLCYGGMIALMPALMADFFAGPRLATIIGLQYTSAAVGSLLGPIGTGFVFDRWGGYHPAFMLGTLLCVGAAWLVATLPAPAKIHN